MKRNSSTDAVPLSSCADARQTVAGRINSNHTPRCPPITMTNVAIR
jgi:hypothetical protein